MDNVHHSTPLNGDGDVPPVPLGVGSGLSGQLSEEEQKVLTSGLQDAFAEVQREQADGADKEVPLSTSTEVVKSGSGSMLGKAREVWDEFIGRHVPEDEYEARKELHRQKRELRLKLRDTLIGTIVVEMRDKTQRVWSIYGDDLEWWEMACTHWPPNDKNEMHIPLDKVKILTESPRFATCTFDATRAFLAAMWGRTLDKSDEDWIKRHPMGQDGGMPQEYVLTALQELVEPYNLAVSRVRIVSGAFFIGDALNQWVEALGCNPFALADHTTTNEEAAKRMNIPLADANRMWRFEFGPDPLRPSVLGERGFAKDAKSTQSSYGGHARFLAPRAGHGDWWYSLQFAPVERVEPYAAAIVYPPYVPRGDVDILMLQDVKGPDGIDIADKVWNQNDPRKWQVARARDRFFGGAPRTSYPTQGGRPTYGTKSTEKAGSTESNGRPRSSGIRVYHADGTIRDETGMLLVGVESDIPYGRLIDEIHKKVGKSAKRFHYADLWQHVSHIFRTPAEFPSGYYCLWCQKSHDPHTQRLDMKFVCEDAYRAVWDSYFCPTKSCQQRFGQDHAPVVMGRDRGKGRTIFQCPSLRCGTEFQVYASDKDVNLVKLAVFVSTTYVTKARSSHH